MPPDPPRRRHRLRLWAPFLALAALAVAWTAAWFVLRGRAERGLDAWIAAEASDGKVWTCLDRAVGGFPFRIELSCGALTYARGDDAASLGRVLVVSQVYDPDHVIAEVSGPLAVRAGAVAVDGRWSLLQASLVLDGGALRRFALVMQRPAFRVMPRDAPSVDLASDRFELHLRPDPERPRAFDVAASAGSARIPALEILLGGGAEPADLEIAATVTEARSLPVRPVPADLEGWRIAGGQVDVSRLGWRSGPGRLEGRATLGLDEAHRPAGTVTLSAAGLEPVIGRVFGDRAAAALSLAGSLLGGSKAARDPSALKPIPPMMLDGGRVRMGPLTLPGLRLDPLY